MEGYYQTFSADKVLRAEHRARLKYSDCFYDGKAEGLHEGQDDMRCKIDKLFDILSKENRLDEFKVALKDPEQLKELFKEFNI